jgi:hypothetical protein
LTGNVWAVAKLNLQNLGEMLSTFKYAEASELRNGVHVIAHTGDVLYAKYTTNDEIVV